MTIWHETDVLNAEALHGTTPGALTAAAASA